MSENIYYGPSVQLAGGTMTGPLTLSNTTLVLAGPNGETLTTGYTSEILTISTSVNTDTAGSLLPANSEIKGVVVRVLAAIPTATSFQVGDATTIGRFSTSIAVALNTTGVAITQIGSTGVAASTPIQVAAAKIRITPSVQPATSTGQIRIGCFYETYVAPTS